MIGQWAIKKAIGMYACAIYAARAISRINQLKLGDSVLYQGKSAIAIQGVSDPYWDIHDPERGRMTVHKSELRLQPLYKRFRFSFMSTYKFFMGYWYRIDVNNRGRFIFKG